MDYGSYVMGLTADRNYCRRLIDAGYDPAERRSNASGHVLIRPVLHRLQCWQDSAGKRMSGSVILMSTAVISA